mgnify:CR=1 FL=1
MFWHRWLYSAFHDRHSYRPYPFTQTIRGCHGSQYYCRYGKDLLGERHGHYRSPPFSNGLRKRVCYWVLGATLGGIFGAMIPFNTEGLDFVLPAMFIVIFLEQ